MFKKRLKHIIKEGIFLCLYWLGFLGRKRQTPIIVYHSVDDSASCISIKPQDFERQMRYIKNHGYKTLTMEEMINLKRQGINLPQKSVVLTFDDGFLNNYEVAFPIIKTLGLTATIFLTTDFIGKKCGWDKKEDIPEIPLLTWEMIKEMHLYGLDFQPHSATHPHLTTLTVPQIKEEILRSKQAIEDKLSKVCRIFCYPYGEFDEKVVDVLVELGFIAAVALRSKKEDLYSLRRIGSARLTTHIAFKTALKGTFPLYYSNPYPHLLSPFSW